jgi:hypothetical protein
MNRKFFKNYKLNSTSIVLIDDKMSEYKLQTALVLYQLTPTQDSQHHMSAGGEP